MNSEMPKRQVLGMWIAHAGRLFRREMDRTIAEVNAGGDDTLSGRNFWVLQYLKSREGEEVYQRDLEQCFKVRGSTVSNMIDLMEQKGLLIRVAANGDARMKCLRLTEKAEAVLASVSASIDAFEEQLRASFTGEDYETLLRLLEQLCNTLEGVHEINERKEPETNS